MEDPRIRKFAQFLIRSAVGLEKGEKILIELHGSETGLMKALVQEAYAVGGKPFVHIFDYAVEGALVQGADAEHMEEIASYELERMRDMDAYIDIRATTNISMWHNVSDEAQKRYRQYYWGPIHLAERCNHTKWSVLRYPNDAMAQLAGVSTEEYEDFYFRACLVDYDKMGQAMQPLQDRQGPYRRSRHRHLLPPQGEPPPWDARQPQHARRRNLHRAGEGLRQRLYHL